MAVEALRFASATRPIVPPPVPVASAPVIAQEWRRRKAGIGLWERGKRRELRMRIGIEVRAEVDRRFDEACRDVRRCQDEADRWWNALNDGDPVVLAAVLSNAFAYARLPVRVAATDGRSAVLILTMPGLDVLPKKIPHVTPTGRLASKAWPATEVNAAYQRLLGGYMLATVRQAWAVGPPLRQLRIIGVRYQTAGAQVYFDVSVDRYAMDWDSNTTGAALLRTAPGGLKTSGTAGRVRPWPKDAIPEETLAMIRRSGSIELPAAQ